MPRDRLTRAQTAGYAAGSVGTGGFGTLPGLVLAYYLTDTLGVAAAVATFVVFAPKALDVVLNPAIGAWSDSWARRTGSRRRFLTIGAVLLPVFFALTFAVPDGVDVRKVDLSIELQILAYHEQRKAQVLGGAS